MNNFAYSDKSPWPDQVSTAVLFVLDVNNDVEQGLLEQWVAAYKSDAVTASEVTVCLNERKRKFNVGALEQALNTSVGTIVAPLRIAWLPERESGQAKLSFRELLMGDPRRPNAIAAKRVLQTKPQRVACVAGAPGSIESLQERFQATHSEADENTAAEFSAFVARQAGIALDLTERRLQGGRYKVPRYVADNLRSNPEFKLALNDLAKEQGVKVAEMMPEVDTYMKEMVSVPTSFYIDLNAKFNKRVLGLGYEDEIVCNPKDIERLGKIVRENPSMLLWTHKTYLDGMVVPKVAYDSDLPIPHMFGGANMSFAGLGFLMRRGGAIFIRRTFQDNPLYKLTLRHYIGYLMEKRFPMTWAFEGTRSRLGKLMPPRYGLLKYVLEACHETNASNINIVPISISYDLIRDVEEYASEQTGRVKTPESLKWFLGYISSLRRPMGRIYVDVGEPVVLDSAPDPDDRLALSKIAFEVAVEANNVTPITVPSLLCLSLLGNAPKALTIGELVSETQALLEWALDRNIRLSNDFDPEHTDHVRGLLDILIGEGLLTRYDEGPEIIYGIAPDQHPQASYYRNTVIHFFVNKAIIELSLLGVAKVVSGERVAAFWQETDRLRDLFKFEFFYAPSEEFRAQLKQELDRSAPHWEAALEQDDHAAIALLNLLDPLIAHATMLPLIEAYIVVADLLARVPAHEELDKKTAEKTAMKYGRQAYLQRRISSEASIGKILFSNAHKQFSHLGLTKAGGSEQGEKRVALARSLRELSHRLDRIRALAIANRDHAISTENVEGQASSPFNVTNVLDQVKSE